MRQIWHFLRLKTNRERLTWLGGGATVVIAGLWAAWRLAVEGQASIVVTKESLGDSASAWARRPHQRDDFEIERNDDDGR